MKTIEAQLDAESSWTPKFSWVEKRIELDKIEQITIKLDKD